MSGVGIYAWQRGCLESKKNQLVAVQLMAAGKHFHMRLKFPTSYEDARLPSLMDMARLLIVVEPTQALLGWFRARFYIQVTLSDCSWDTQTCHMASTQRCFLLQWKMFSDSSEHAYGYEQNVFTLIVLLLCHLKLLNMIKSNIKWKTNSILY